MEYSIILYGLIAIVTAIFAELSVRVRSILLKNINIFFMLLIPSLFAGLRNGVGTDFYTYTKIFESVKIGMPTRVELGYDYLNFIVAKLGGNMFIVLFLSNIIMLLFIYLSLVNYKNKISVGLGMLVFMLLFYQSSFNVIRLMLAVSISFYNIKNILEGRLLKFLLFTILAMCFHTTSIILLPFYIIFNYLNKQEQKVWRFCLYLVVLLFIFNYDKILEPFLSSNLTLEYYTKYLDRSESSSYSITYFFLYFICLIPGLILYKKIIKQKKEFIVLYTFVVIGFLLKISKYFTAEYVDRLSTYFLIVLVLVIPYYLGALRSKKTLIYNYVIIVYIFGVWYVEYFYWKNHGTIPYQWIL